MDMKVNVDIDQALIGRARKATEEGLATAAVAVQREAVARTPVKDGDLRRSANNTVNGYALEAEISFDTPYAARQHEETGWNHPKGGQAKYLESALEDMTDKAMQIVSTAIRRAG